MPRIGYVLRRFPVLSETFVISEILALEALGFDIEIFALEPPREEPLHEMLSRMRGPVRYAEAFRVRSKPSAGTDGCRRVGVASSAWRARAAWRLSAAQWIAREASRAGLTRLHAHFATAATDVALLAGMAAGLPVSFTAHAYDIWGRRAPAWKLRRRMKMADRVVTVSDYNLAWLADLAPECAGKVTRVYSGIDLARFPPCTGVRRDRLRLLAVARLVPKKGLDVLLEACAALAREGIDFACDIVGDGPERASLESLVHALGLSRRVTFHGALAHEVVTGHLAGADVFVLPCRQTPDGARDGLPVAILEAMASALPVVSTTVAGVPEAVRDGIEGLLVAPDDAGALTRALSTLLGDDQARVGMGRAARARAEALFDSRRSALALAALLGPPSNQHTSAGARA